MSRNRAESIFAQGNFSWNSQVFEVCGWSPGRKKDIIHFFSCTTEQNREGKPSTKSVSLKNKWVNAFFWSIEFITSGVLYSKCLGWWLFPALLANFCLEKNRFNVIVNDYMHANFWICHFRLRYTRILGCMPPNKESYFDSIEEFHLKTRPSIKRNCLFQCCKSAQNALRRHLVFFKKGHVSFNQYGIRV